MKIAFFGTWEFSKNILKSLIDDFSKDISIKLVISQPDKIIWRKKILTKTQTKILAEKYNIEVLQPEDLKYNKITEKLKNLDLDFIVVVAYGKMIPKEILEIPKYWCINIHWSILPKYRWASPIQESIKSGDIKTGITIMYMSEKMDEWDILSTKQVEIQKNDKTEDIFKKFEQIWSELLVNTLKKVIKNEIIPKKQNEKYVTYCHKIKKTDWEINFTKLEAEEIYNKFRAYSIWPWIYTYYKWKKFIIENCCLEYHLNKGLQPLVHKKSNELQFLAHKENKGLQSLVHIGKVVKIDKKVWIFCKSWILILKKIKLEWKKSMNILDFVNWKKEFLNSKL